jgi:hypothetical protein
MKKICFCSERCVELFYWQCLGESRASKGENKRGRRGSIPVTPVTLKRVRSLYTNLNSSCSSIANRAAQTYVGIGIFIQLAEFSLKMQPYLNQHSFLGGLPMQLMHKR